MGGMKKREEQFHFNIPLCPLEIRLPTLLQQVVLREVLEGRVGEGGVHLRVGQVQGLPRSTLER
ncbi:hypothetical protein Syun_011639 [Stephania yunnanensis]|uniref:Uncharacterized protein n=1 Tax=Stephania yunnanensis TaxID=152371 RepID=A0AAP0PGP2_9MAGN